MINNGSIIQRRNFYVRNLVRDFLLSFKAFKELKNKYKTSGIESSDFDLLIGGDKNGGFLKRIKKLCPIICNKDDISSFYFASIMNFLYCDIYKLRELCKFIEYHDFLLKEFETTSRCVNKTSFEQERIFNDCHRFIDTSFIELKEGFDRIDKFFHEASNQLKCLIFKERSNSLLIRFLLIEGRWLLENVWNQGNEVNELLLTLFPEGLDQAYCFAAEDYFEGSWFDKAKEAYLYALKINPDCEQAKDGLRLLNKRLEELAQIQEKERERFTIDNFIKSP